MILFCAHGTNSIEAAEELEAEGYRAYSLEGGYIAWLREEMRRQEAEDIKNQVETEHPQKISQNQFWSPIYQSSKQYELVKEGDKVAVCISGGKDSMLMAKLFQELKLHNKFPFEVEFLVMDPGYSPDNRHVIEENARKLGIPVHILSLTSLMQSTP